MDKFIETLAQEGWQNIELGMKDGRTMVTADYPLGPYGSMTMPGLLKGMTIKVEKAENGYEYYTVEGQLDFAAVQQTWDGFVAQANKGTDIDLGEWLGEVKGITPEQFQAIVRRNGVPRVTLRVRLPGNTPIDARGPWVNLAEYQAGTTNTLEYVWQAGNKTPVSLHVSRRLEPQQQASPEQAQANLQALLQQYNQQIPVGYPMDIAGYSLFDFPGGISSSNLSGWLNNFFFAPLGNWRRKDDQSLYTCGNYQTQVTMMLDQIRTNPDPAVRNLLGGWDYGPIQTQGGGHRAVVLFPQGSDWRQDGIVLDPWFTQRPATYPIKEWVGHYLPLSQWGPFVKSAEPDSGDGALYPHLNGKPSSYPYMYDYDKNRAQPVERILVVNSPVTVMVEFRDGGRAGVMPGKDMVNTRPVDVSFYPILKEDGELTWIYLLPADVAKVTVYGQSDGEVHVLMASPDATQGYGPQTILEGEAGTLLVDESGGLSPMQFESGPSAEAHAITQETFAGEMGLPEGEFQPAPDVQSQAEAPDASQDYSGIASLLVYGCPCCLCLTGAIALAGAIVLIFRKRKVRRA
jgi:hypothetical protein